MKPRLLDLFCGAGGAAMGYYRAGFEVVGVDIKPQPHYPFEFHQADALTYPLEGFDAYHASPPCQFASIATPVARKPMHRNYIPSIRERLKDAGKPYVIENVKGARYHLIDPIMLCGTMFGLYFWRHRYFECRPELPFILMPPCNHKRGFIDTEIGRIRIPVLCTGGGDGKRAKRKTWRPRQPSNECRWAMGVPWMTYADYTEAIPPAYTEFIGKYLMKAINKSEGR